MTRKTRPLGLDRHENSAEHSWQIALLARALEPYADSPVDIERVTTMLLVHDVGEIETGDTIVYAEGGWDERKRAEEVAVRRIFGILPDGRGDRFIELWLEFERSETPESRFANAVDRAMPVLLNLANHGQSWRENGSHTSAWWHAWHRRSAPAALRSGRILRRALRRRVTPAGSSRRAR